MILETVIQNLNWSKQQTITGDCFKTADLTFGTLVLVMSLNNESDIDIMLDTNLDEILKEPHKIDEVVLKLSFVENQNMYVLKSLDEYSGECKSNDIQDEISDDEIVMFVSNILKSDKKKAAQIIKQILKQAES